VGPHLRRLTSHLIWGMLAMTVFTVVDTLYISRLGTTALAALGFTMPMVMFFMGIIFGMMVGTTSVLSRAYGEGDFEKVRRLATDSLVLMTLLTLTAAVTGYFLIDHIFLLMGATEAILPLIHHYMAIWYCGMIFSGLLLGSIACLRATGETRVPSGIMTITALINVTLDPFLIFGWGPFPTLGLAGAAFTLVIANAVTGIAALYYLIFRKKLLSARLFHEDTFKSWRKILHVGVPSIIGNLISPLSAAVVTWMAADLGKEAVAALGVATRIEGLAILLFFALGAGVSIFTGQNFGAGNYGRISEIGRLAEKYALLWSVGMAALLWIFAARIPLYFDQHPDVVRYTTEYLRIVPISYGAMGVLVISNAALNAMGKPLPATTLILLRAFAVYIPLAYIAEKHFGFTGILLALAATNIIVGIASHLWNKMVTP
jgi:putative MATE family efflux protein